MSSIHVGLSTTMVEPALTKGHIDGIGVYTNALLQGLPATGCEVTGFSFSMFPGKATSSQFLTGTAMPQSFSVLSMRDLMMPSVIRSRLPVDLYHATDYRIVRMNCPVVATLHDAIPLKYPEWTNARLRSIKNWMQKKAAKKADHVIALSQFSVTELVEYFGINEEKITVVHCGVSAHWLEMLPQDEVQHALAQYGLRSGYFLFVGTLQPRKNVERILQAYLMLSPEIRKERQLVIVGRAGRRCETVLAQIRDAQEQDEQVVWLNGVEGEEALRRVYAGAGAFVFPSLHEGFGIPVVEAFASGVPVVTSNTTSLPEVSQGAALEVDPLSVGEISEAMASLVRDAALNARCIAAGRQRAAQLTWRHTVEKTAAVYRAVLKR